MALEASQSAVWDSDLTKGTVFLDERWAKMIGEPPHESTVTQLALGKITHPEDIYRVTRQQLKVTNGQSDNYQIEHRVRHQQGHWIWILSRGNVVERDASGRALRMIGINTDITPQKTLSELALRENKFLEALHQTTLDLLSRREIKDLLQAIVDRAAMLLEAPFSEISLLENNQLITQASAVEDPLPLSKTTTREVAQLSWQACDTGKTVVVNDYSTHPLRRKELDVLSIRALVVFPIMHGQTCLGVLSLCRQTMGASFTPAEIRNGEMLAQQAALVLHNASIYQDAVHVAEQRTIALKESEERFRGLFDYSPTIIALLTIPEGRFIEINESGLKVMGYTREALIGRTTTELNMWVHPHERAEYLGKLRAAGFVTNFEARMRKQNGTETAILYNGRIVTFAGQMYSLNMMQDITELKQAEATLRQFRAAMDQSADTILLVDPVTSRFIDCNESACAQLGYTREELLQLSVVDIEEILPDHFEWNKHIEHLRRCNQMTIEGAHRRKNGSTLPVEVNVRYLSQSPADCIVAIARDITERKQAEAARQLMEAQLRQAQKMESIGTLAGGIAHDFNNILTGMLGFIELTRFELPPKHPGLEWLDQLAKSSDRAKNLVRQILTFSRKEQGARVRLNLVAVASEALRLLRATLPTTVEIRLDFPATEHLVLADATQIHQCIMNLCTNAWHALPEKNGCIQISIAACSIKEAVSNSEPPLVQGEYVRLTVADNGSGMEPAVIERMFDPFFTTKKTGQGTGLGLAVVHGIIRAHGGSIKVQSNVGRGTSIDLLFPIFTGPVAI